MRIRKMRLVGLIMIIIGYFTMADFGNARIIADFGTRSWLIGMVCVIVMGTGFVMMQLGKEYTDNSRAA